MYIVRNMSNNAIKKAFSALFPEGVPKNDLEVDMASKRLFKELCEAVDDPGEDVDITRNDLYQ